MMHDQRWSNKFFGKVRKVIADFEFNLEKVLGDSRENTLVPW